MTGKDIFKIWAPKGVPWSNWVRPVPFININNTYNINCNFNIPNIINIPTNTAIIVDLPGINSVEMGIALAQKGFIPIPIYNGTIEQEGAISTTDNKTIITGLILGASILEKIEIPKDAPPAFLLDTNRMNRFKMNISVFDNSWDIYAQDLPTAEYFINNNIKQIIVIGKSIQKDLKIIFRQFRKKGIKIYITNGYDIPKKR